MATANSSELRSLLEDLFRAAVTAVDPQRLVEAAMPELKAETYEQVFVIAVGKAAAPMMRGAYNALGSQISRALVVLKPGHGEPPPGVEVVAGGHPVPNQGSIDAATRVLEILEDADESTLCLFLISGGGSALMEKPIDTKPAIDLEALQQTTQLLLRAGAPIEEINAVRKHLSAVKGGRAAAAAAPARVVSLILSDVVGDRLDTIASGPTAPDNTSYQDAKAILEARGIWTSVPPAVAATITRGTDGKLPETLKPGDRRLDAVDNLILGSNAVALSAAEDESRRRGYSTVTLSSSVVGEAREIAPVLIAVGREIAAHNRPLAAPAVVLAGGETTVTVTGAGVGGRNQEAAVAALCNLQSHPFPAGRRLLFLAAATDGNDGPTDAAGGFASPEIAALPLNPRAALANNDSYHFLRNAGALFSPGATGTNVCDMWALVVV